MVKFIEKFNNISKSDTLIAGGKGASLGEMTGAGISVPSGFVILSEAFDQFLKKTDLNIEIDSILHGVDTKKLHTINQASEKIQVLILGKEIPVDIANSITNAFEELNTEFVAVRSSATAEDSTVATWAGQLDSFLNTTKETLFENVKKCLASLFTPRAIFYRFEQNLHGSNISVAVVVQKMIQSEVSGVAFSVHPVTEDYNQLIIEAGLGLGESIVSGQITPDSYVVKKKPRRIIDRNVITQERGIYRGSDGSTEWRDIKEKVGEKQALTDQQILKLTGIILKIEKHYGFPVDVEWVYAEGIFFITQSRPITTLAEPGARKNPNKKMFLKKSYTREHSLFWNVIWSKGETEGLRKFIGVCFETILFLREPDSKNMSVWYEPNEADNLYLLIEDKIKKNPDFFHMVALEFNKYYELLLPYFENTKQLTSLNELEIFYTNFVNWWPPMTIIYAIPSLKELPKEIRDEALKIREDFERFSDTDELANFIHTMFPQYDDIAFNMLPEEIFSLKNKEFTSEELEVISDRKNGFGILGGHLYGYNDLLVVLKQRGIELKVQSIENTHELQGDVAFPGLVNGKVRLLLSKDDIPGLKEGEILVTHMTSPDFVLVMKKAAAIVTDEGGITCHASIVSRELKRPCIIGTKIATQVLKDGDFVEVNANEGIVRILKKKK